MDNITPDLNQGKSKLPLILCAVFGVLLILFMGLLISSYMQAQAATKDLNAKRAAAYNLGKTAGAQTQKETDDAAAKTLAENPYRSYTAPVTFGDFTIKFPKNWSAWVAENISSSNQVELIASPDFIKVLPDNSVNYALHVMLVNSTYTNLRQNYDQQVKDKKAKATSVTISGISGTRYEGQYSQTKSGIIVLVPVRDKTMVLSTENTKFSSEFSQILTQSTIKP